MTARVLVYGATGFSGGLLVDGLGGERVVLGGRDAATLARMAATSGSEWRAFGLDEAAVVDAALGDVAVVVNCAGPFRETAAPMMAACLRNGTHYLDIAGEWPVFAHAMQLTAAAAAAKIVLLPGIGFSITATDCVLAMAAAAMPDCARLRLAVSRPRRIARGSVQTILALNDAAVRVRRCGVVEALPAGRLSREFDFGQGPAHAVAVTWPDVFTAQGTTGINNIETYIEGGWGTQAAIRAGAVFAPVTAAAAAPWLRAASALNDSAPAKAASDPGIVIVVEAEDRWRRVQTLRLRSLDGYSVTTATAAAAVCRILDDDMRLRIEEKVGFTTPARLFGADFILGLGCAAMIPAANDRGNYELH